MTETYTTQDFVHATEGSMFVGYSPEVKTHSETYTSGPSAELETTDHAPVNHQDSAEPSLAPQVG